MVVGGLALGVGYFHCKDLPVAVLSNPVDDHNALAYYPMVYPRLLIGGIHEEVRVSVLIERPISPVLKLDI